MDLVGPIHPPSSRGNKYMLTVIDMLTGFTMAVPIKNKNAETICDAYRNHIYCTFGGSSRILMDNGSEFKNKEMRQVCETLGVKHIFSPVYTPESNRHLEGWHRFFKACIAKHSQGGGVKWDELVPLEVSAYNFFPCQSSKESPFILMFGRDPITPVAKLLEPRPRYYGERGSALKMDKLRRLYTVVIQNICKAREKITKNRDEPHSFKVNDMVLVKDPDAAVFGPRYQPNFRVRAIFSNNRIKVQDECGHKSIRRSAHIKYIEPSEKVIQQLPSEQVLKNYGRSLKLLLTAKDIPDLQFNVAEAKEKGESSERTDVVEIIDMDKNRSVMMSQNSDFREHSKNLLENAAGEALEQASEQRSVKKMIHLQLHNRTSEYRELSQKSRSSEKAIGEETSRKIVHRMLNKGAHPGHSENREDSQNSWKKQAGVDIGNVNVTVSIRHNQCSAGVSDFLEHSQNSLSNGEPKVDKGQVNVSFSANDGQCLVAASEFREVSSNSWVQNECSQGTHHKQSTKSVCISEPSEFLRDSLGGVGSNVSVPKFSWFKSMSQIVGLTAAWQQNKVEGNPMGASTASNAKTNSNPVHTEFNFFL